MNRPRLSTDQIIATLGLEPLADEGGQWAQSWRDEHSSGIYFLLQPGDFSALHRLSHTELWHRYAGAPVQMLLLADVTDETQTAARIEKPILGVDIAGGERPCIPVPARTWMGAATLGDWSLVGATVTPPFKPEVFELGSRQYLIDRFPEAEHEIRALTRS